MRTVAWRTEDIQSKINSQLKANDFEWFSLTRDELPDVTSTTQLLCIWEARAEFEVTEELASMNTDFEP